MSSPTQVRETRPIRSIGSWAFAVAAFVGIVSCAPTEPFDQDAYAQNDHAVALMRKYEYAKAADVFEQVVESMPDWSDGRVNLAIATLNRQLEGDEQKALDILAEVLNDDPGHMRAMYTTAILELYLGRADQAVVLLERVASADPDDAYAAYFLGQALLQTSQYARAGDWFLTSIEIEPYLRSAYWAGAQALRRAGRVDESQRLLADYGRFESNPAVRLAGFSYLRMGPKAEALVAIERPAPPSPTPTGPLFAAPVPLAPATVEDGTVGTVDIDADGRQDLVVVRAPQPLVLVGSNGGFETAPQHPLSAAGPALAALWGDVDDDGLVDAVLCGESGTRLWRQQAAGTWSPSDALEAHPCSGGALFDADHDGDLDVFVVGSDGNELFSNNRDGTFRRLAAAEGIRGKSGRQVLAADFDSDRDLDILVLNDTPPHDVWRNDRLWEYAPMPGMEDLAATDLLALTISDIDADGTPEIFGAAPDGGLLGWRRREGGWQREHIIGGTPVDRAFLDAADFDGDGRPEILRAGPGAFEVLDPRTGEILFQQDVEGLHTALALVADRATGPAIVAGTRDGLVLWPPGPGRHNYLTVSPTGRSESDRMRSNSSGIGTRLQVRTGGRWTVLEYLDPHSGPGQNLQPLSVGLGTHPKADFIALEWTDGVSQTEVNLAAGEHHVIEEIQRQLASCPVVFAWNGTGFEFVSDVLGGAALGYLSAPDRYVEPRPMEGFLLGSSQLAPRDGRYAIKLGEPMEETTYLDALRLTVYDLPEGWDMVLDERMAVRGPPATSRAIVFRRWASPARATRADGVDVTELVADRDHRTPPVGDIDPRFIGLLADEQIITLEFQTPLPTEGAVLVADGWIEYPYSQTVFAAWQAGLRYRPPTLEARLETGEWVTLATEFGYPAGMPRTMALPLTNLPPGTVALRLSSNMEIYWDRLRVVWEEPLEVAEVATLAPVAARVARTGFARRTTGPQRLPHYDYGDRSPYWDAKAPTGFYTAYGDGIELVRDIDGALAIITSGEEIHVEFAAVPPPQADHRRFFRIEFHGWAKDMDLYTLNGDTVEPLPVPQDADPSMLAKRERLHAQYNVRFRQGL